MLIWANAEFYYERMIKMTDTIIRNFGGFTIKKELTENTVEISWTGEEPSIRKCFEASDQFNSWTDKMFKEFMNPSDTKYFIDAWNNMSDEMGPGKEVCSRIIEPDGFIKSSRSYCNKRRP